ncbi:aquaporin-9-like [Diadema antillarum]|uniref:aquaporin-9-like n=1 Tax=Diadema antillarum TaxID=105358 RepID=UPI003A87F4A9
MSTSNFQTAFSIGMALALSIYSGFGVSGGHLNSAVSVGLAAVGAFPWWKVPFYAIAQLMGGFLGAGTAYLIYTDAFDDLDGGTRQVFGENGTASIFATFPQPFLSPITAVFEQILNTALMLALIGAVADRRNQAPPQGIIPLFFGFIVFVIIHAYGYNAGAPLNPTLDLSGRLVLAAAGYGSDIWIPRGSHWWVIPIVGPTIGSALGSWSYYLAVELHHPRVDDTAELGLEGTNLKQESADVDTNASTGQISRNSADEHVEDHGENQTTL